MPQSGSKDFENIELRVATRYSYDKDDFDFDSPNQAISRGLLGSTSSEDSAFDVEIASLSKPKATPIPKLQVFTLCAVRIVDPISFTQLFPYVNEMMQDLHVTTHASRIGYYSGFLDSVFSVSQLFSIYHWGKLSDKIGRRPVIFTSTLGIALCTSWFGLSTTLWSALAARSLSGLLAGNIAVIHSTLGELTDESNQSVIFPIYGMVWPLGGIIGPLIGGTFSHPDQHWPQYFDTNWFRVHPYFLPCLICSILSFTAAMFGIRSLEEVLIRELLSNPLVRALCLSGAGLAFLGSSFDVVFVLFCFSPIASGGLSRPADLIGYSLAVSGFTSATLQMFFMPWFLRNFNLDKMYRVCMCLFPFTFASLPLLNLLARQGLNEEGVLTVEWVKVALWGGIIVSLAMSRVAVLAYSLALILIKNASPSPEALGSTNGLAQWFQCMTRSFSPAFVSSLFALSISNNLLGGYLWVIVMCSLSFIAIYITAKIPEARRQVERAANS
ncbi:hypothetical protein M422DRAFT_58696 [Sphaerobolus stellatus SS14]|nr:hypothetical protein M422DRAFT_58696 [Sphaerobolus stellatus SS14]